MSCRSLLADALDTIHSSGYLLVEGLAPSDPRIQYAVCAYLRVPQFIVQAETRAVESHGKRKTGMLDECSVFFTTSSDLADTCITEGK